MNVDRQLNKSCFSCGRQYPKDIRHDYDGEHGRYCCKSCGSILLYEITADGGEFPSLPFPARSAPAELTSAALAMPPVWQTYEAYYLDRDLYVVRVNGRTIYGQEKHEKYVDYILSNV